jgi:hypothetical protein
MKLIRIKDWINSKDRFEMELAPHPTQVSCFNKPEIAETPLSVVRPNPRVQMIHSESFGI